MKKNNLLSAFKIPLIILGVFLILIFAFMVIAPLISNANRNKTPIVSITATNSKEYKLNEEIKPSDFDVVTKHKDGGTSTLSSDEYILSKKKIDPVGKETVLDITLSTNKDIKCTVKVKNNREKVVSFDCGYPDTTKVKAVLYTNGELSFEGEGDVLAFEDNEFPWLDYDEEENYPINAVSFAEKVQPKNMDYWFSGIETLTYIANIPTSVKTMISTFEDTALEKTPDLSQCTQLLNINSAFASCKNLIAATTIPSSVIITESAFDSCIELQKGADVSNAVGLTNASGMYSGCSKLLEVEVAPNTTDMSSFCSNCINLKNMPTIPETVKNMESAFLGCLSLEKLTNIPKSVEEMSSCFSSCELLEGTITINTNTENYSGIFNDAAIATTLNLTGSSSMLNEYASTSDNNRVLVNGKPYVEKEQQLTDEDY